MLDPAYLAAHVAMLCAYLLVGKTFWRLVQSSFEDDVHSLVRNEQEKNGHFSMLLPKFSVIALWPLVAVIGVVSVCLSVLRSTVLHT